MGPVRMSLKNLQHNKLSMEEMGKVGTIETDEEEEELQALITMEKKRRRSGGGYPIIVLCNKTASVCPFVKRENQSAKEPGRNENLTPDPAPPQHHCI